MGKIFSRSEKTPPTKITVNGGRRYLATLNKLAHPTWLILDDIVGSMSTFEALLRYFESQLGEEIKEKIRFRFLFLYTTREDVVDKIRAYLLSEDEEIRKFQVVHFESITPHQTLPYEKNIHHGGIQQSRAETGLIS